MISFRFHLVSLVAVFLALALGIGMGATVIDKATVDSLKRRVASVEQQRDTSNQQVNDLNRRINRESAWDTQAQQLLISNALTEVPVSFVAVRGVDEGSLNEQRKVVQASGAAMQGTLWFSQKLNLTDSGSVTTLQNLLAQLSADPGQLRQALLATSPAAVLAGASPPSSLKDLQRAGFLDWDGGLSSDISNGTSPEAALFSCRALKPSCPTIKLQHRSQNFSLRNQLVELLQSKPVATLAQTLQASAYGWTRSAKTHPSTDASTVDDVETDLGRTATVLATRQFSNGKTGDYGIGESADGALPKPVS